MNLKEFYKENASRRASLELRFGIEWRLEGRKGAWSCFWVRDTGELAVFRAIWNRGFYDNDLLEFLAWLSTRKRTSVRILLVESDQEALEDRLLGWEQQHATPNGLDWLMAATPL